MFDFNRWLAGWSQLWPEDKRRAFLISRREEWERTQFYKDMMKEKWAAARARQQQIVQPPYEEPPPPYMPDEGRVQQRTYSNGYNSSYESLTGRKVRRRKK